MVCVIGHCVGAHTELALLLKHRLDSGHNSSYLGESLQTGTGTVIVTVVVVVVVEWMSRVSDVWELVLCQDRWWWW